MSVASLYKRIRYACCCVVAASAALLAPAQAGTLVYSPTNPTFGGNPLNGSYLFNNAQVQNQYSQSAAGSAGTGSAALTPGQIFAQQLTSQLYSSLANKITTAIFGENAQTTITYTRVGGNINISINDGQTITNVSVPAGP
jgi:curli production assembly/transport component CsgF